MRNAFKNVLYQHKFECTEFEEFFRKPQLQELFAPMLTTPAPVNTLPVKQPHKQNRRLVVPTVLGLPYLTYKIRGCLWYSCRGKQANKYKDPPPTDPPLPCTGVYNENGERIININGKWTDVQRLSFLQRLGHQGPPWKC